MKYSDLEWYDILNSVTTIPIIPFRAGKIYYQGLRKNIQYLMKNNSLSDDRPRIISLAGTSLIHHIDFAEQDILMRLAGEEIGEEGILMSALLPNSMGQMKERVKIQQSLSRPPDLYLIMPVQGVYSSEGLYDSLYSFAREMANQFDTKFLFYHRLSRDNDAVINLIRDCGNFLGVKVGTGIGDVPTLVQGIGAHGMVIWGIGDRSTEAIKLGAKGHTSGISVVVAKAGDHINNCQRKGDWTSAIAMESRIDRLEKVRFRENRAFNYSAVVEAMKLSGFQDVDGGEGGPFNPVVPKSVSLEIDNIIREIVDLH